MLPITSTIHSIAQSHQVTLEQNNPLPAASFSTGSCFLWLHDKNTALKMNIRGMVNHEYNRLLVENNLVSHLIPGGEDLEQLGMDQKTSIVRPDLYLNACQKVLSVHTSTPFDGLNLSTAIFCDLLHEYNIAHSANVRGLINQRYNELLSQAGIHDGKIPGYDLEQLGMDKDTVLRAEFYAKAYRQVIVQFEPAAKYSHCCAEPASGTFKSHFIAPCNPPGFQIKPASIEFFDCWEGYNSKFDLKEVNIQCYPNYNELRSSFNFLKNGFEYCQFEEPVLTSIRNLSTKPDDEFYRKELGAKMVDYLTQWGRKNGIDFDCVGLLGFQYRSSDIKGGATKPAFFAHVDFKASGMEKTLRAFHSEWKPSLEQTVGCMTEEKYSSLNITQIVNLWLPFNTTPTSNTLAVMDLSNAETSPTQLDDYPNLSKSFGFYTILVARHNPNQKWVAHESMSLGQCILFNTLKTPHSSVNILSPLGELDFRRSVEGRFAFIKW